MLRKLGLGILCFFAFLGVVASVWFFYGAVVVHSLAAEDSEKLFRANHAVMSTIDAPGDTYYPAEFVFEEGVLIYLKNKGAFYWVEKDQAFAINPAAQALSPDTQTKTLDLAGLTPIPTDH